MKNIYELTADDPEIVENPQNAGQKVQELVLDLVTEGWFLSGGFNVPADLKTAGPVWNYKAVDPDKVKEAFGFREGMIVRPLLDRSKFKVFTPEEYAEYQSMFGGGA